MSKKYNFINNKPIGEDLFEGKSQYRTANVITDIIEDDKFQVIGIDGGWGVGKSNLVKIVEFKLEDHIFFIYDVWGHQEDEQRRSLLIELTNYLTKKENNFIKKGKWKKKLKILLSKKKEVTTENLPYLSIGFIFSLIAIIYAPTVLAFKDELSNWLGVKSIFWRLVLVLFPIIIVIGIYIFNFFKNWVNGESFWTSFAFSAQETFQIYTNKQRKETKIESITEEEPSVKSFQEWMSEIDDDLNKKLVLVLDNFDRLPKKHILNVWSSIHVFFAEKQYKNIKVIIPFDRKHIKHAFSDIVHDSSVNYADDYINKTFDIVFRVAPPIMSSWKDFFRNHWDTAFKDFDENEFERVEQAYEILSSNITPREIVSFINKFISVKLIDDKIPDRYIAIYLLCQSKILEHPLKAITEFEYLKGLEPIYKNDENYQKHITALAYQIDSDNALEVIYKNRLRESLLNNNLDDFNEIKELPTFKYLIKPVVVELGDYRKPIHVLDNLTETDNIKSSLINLLWNLMHSNIKEKDLNPGSVEQYQLILLKNLEIKKQKLWLKNILETLWIDKEDFDIVKYLDNIDKIDDFINKEKIEIDAFNYLKSRAVSPKQLKIVIDKKQAQYRRYNLSSEIKKIDDYLISIEAENLSDASFIKFVDKTQNLKKFHESLIEKMSKYKRDKTVLFYILNFLKITSIQKLDLQSKISEGDIHQLLNTASLTDDIFVDLAAIRLSFLKNNNSYQGAYNKILRDENESIEFHQKVAEQIEWYISYDELLIGSINFSNNLMLGVIKQVIKLRPPHRVLKPELILEKITSIGNKNDIDLEELLSTLNTEDSLKLDKSKILEFDPQVLFVLKESNSIISTKVINEFTSYYRNLGKKEWEESFKDLKKKLFQQLKMIDFVSWNPFALEVFNSLLLKIADGSNINNYDVLKWLISSFEESERDLTATLKNLRDRLIQNNNVSADVFCLFLKPLLDHANLDAKANDISRTFFKTEFLDSNDCIANMINNSDQIKDILKKSDKYKIEFRDGLKARINNESIEELSRQLGFRLKSEKTDKDEK